jgi:hypothetical protein
MTLKPMAHNGSFYSGLCVFWGSPASSKWLESHISGRTTLQGADQFAVFLQQFPANPDREIQPKYLIII